jgi:hypothetical protein
MCKLVYIASDRPLPPPGTEDLRLTLQEEPAIRAFYEEASAGEEEAAAGIAQWQRIHDRLRRILRGPFLYAVGFPHGCACDLWIGPVPGDVPPEEISEEDRVRRRAVEMLASYLRDTAAGGEVEMLTAWWDEEAVARRITLQAEELDPDTLPLSSGDLLIVAPAPTSPG